jgi:spore cortex biosynthesis protein YabQ
MTVPLLPDTYTAVQDELLLFGGACLLGIPAGVLFDLFRVLRRILPHRSPAVALEDILFLLLCSVLLLCYSIYAGGVFRMYYALGMLMGFWLYLCTIGQLVCRVCTGMLRLLCKPINWLVRICRKVSERFVRNAKNAKKEE